MKIRDREFDWEQGRQGGESGDVGLSLTDLGGQQDGATAN